MQSFAASRFILVPLLCLLTGCSTAILAQRGPYLRAYHEGALCQAEEKVDALACQTQTKEGYQCSKESSWILLDRATMRFAMNKIEEAICDYSQALEALDYYDQSLPTEQCAQLLLQDETAAYQADDFEQVLARVYFALALLHQGDESNAYALLRQAEEYPQEKRQFYTKVPFTRHYRLTDNGLSKYLFALLLERKGDLSNANLLYQQASQLLPNACQASCRSRASPQQATVLVICHNGNAPYKISATSPASVASACALEFLLATQHIDPAWSTLTGIPVPALQQWPGSYPLPTYAQLDGIPCLPLLPFYNVTQAASEELEQKMPVIVARGVARLLMRRCAVGYLDRQDPYLGMLADLTMWIINDQTRADTRSWSTLPATIDVARFDVAPGCHCLTLQVVEGMSSDTRSYQLNLKPRDLCIVHIFNIHSGVRQILIPSQYLATQGESL
jgi:tetratricopeptide (TPR) repeat protein